MRGTTTLLLHSIDPESLDRIDDLDSLDPESEEDQDDLYKEMDSVESDIPHRYRIPDQYNQPEYNLSSRSLAKNAVEEINSFPISELLRPSLSSSPPLIKSHYHDDRKESCSSPTQLNETMSRLIHSYSSSQSDSLKEKTFTSSGSGLPLSRVKSCRNGISSSDRFSDEINLDEATNQRGFARFLHTIGLTDKLRQSKVDKNRFNIHNLPPQLKEELKQIYVY